MISDGSTGSCTSFSAPNGSPGWSRADNILLLFGCVLGLWLIGGLIGGAGFQRHLTWPGIILSFLTAVYTAFLFAQAKGRDFWQSPLLSVHMLLHAVLAGGAVLLLFHSVFDDAAAERLRMVLLVSIVLSVLAFFGELYFPHATHDAKSAAQEISAGKRSASILDRRPGPWTRRSRDSPAVGAGLAGFPVGSPDGGRCLDWCASVGHHTAADPAGLRGRE